jgi:hypothetical protein
LPLVFAVNVAGTVFWRWAKTKQQQKSENRTNQQSESTVTTVTPPTAPPLTYHTVPPFMGSLVTVAVLDCLPVVLEQVVQGPKLLTQSTGHVLSSGDGHAAPPCRSLKQQKSSQPYT